MKIYGHRKHRYENMATNAVTFIPGRDWVEVPDGIGKIILEGHPDKLCDVTNEDNPSEHVCPLTAIPDPIMTSEAAAVYDRIVTDEEPVVVKPRLSGQKRKLRTKGLRRSLQARRAHAEK